jgi:hypothetical protein
VPNSCAASTLLLRSAPRFLNRVRWFDSGRGIGSALRRTSPDRSDLSGRAYVRLINPGGRPSRGPLLRAAGRTIVTRG